MKIKGLSHLCDRPFEMSKKYKTITSRTKFFLPLAKGGKLAINCRQKKWQGGHNVHCMDDRYVRGPR